MERGDYVRTLHGLIYKLGYFSMSEGRWICFTKDDWVPVYEDNIIRSSSNIIDLIEVGDIITFGYVYSRTQEVKNIKVLRIKNEADLILQRFYFTNKKRVLKSIVTKEQFTSMEYEVELEGEI